jgi:multiple sugar transport system permease protein
VTAIARLSGAGRPRSSRQRRLALTGYLCISPWLIGFVVFTGGPIIASLVLSFTRWGILSAPEWIGLDNYQQALFKDPLFWKSVRVTTIYSFGSVPLNMAFGLLLAVLLNQKVKVLGLFRTFYYLPAVLSGVAVSMMWIWVFNQRYGILNFILRQVGIIGPAWLADPKWVLPAFIIMSLWGVGGGMLVYLGGLQGVPSELYEAATIDGANAVQRFARITIPLITPVLFFNLINGIIGSFQVFTPAYVMTGGGPADATLFYVLYLYRNAFVYGFGSYGMGYACALAWMLFAAVVVLTLLILRSSPAWVHYEGIGVGKGQRW